MTAPFLEEPFKKDKINEGHSTIPKLGKVLRSHMWDPRTILKLGIILVSHILSFLDTLF